MMEEIIFKNLGLNPEQIFQLVSQRERTRQLELELAITKEQQLKKRRIRDVHHQNRKKNKLTTTVIICDDSWVKILEYLPNLDGFKNLLVSKQLNNATKFLYKLDLYNTLDARQIKYFIKSKMFKQVQELNFHSFYLGESLFCHLLENCQNIKVLIANVESDFEFSIPDEYRNNFTKLEVLQLTIDDHENLQNDLFFTNNNSIMFNLKTLLLDSYKTIPIKDILNNYTRNIEHLTLNCACEFTVKPKIHLPKLVSFNADILVCEYEVLISFFHIKSLKKFIVGHNDDGMEDFIEDNIQILTVPELEELSITGNIEFIEYLSKCQFPKLQILQIENTTVTNLANNASLTNLQHLEIQISNNKMFEILCASSYFKNVTSLIMNDPMEEEDSSDALKYISQSESFQHLQKLQLLVRGVDLSYLRSDKLNHLEELSLSNPDVNTLNDLAESRNLKLKKLDMKCSIPNDFLKILSTNESFDELKILGAKLRDSDIPYLLSGESCLDLKSIMVYGHKLTAVGAQQLDTLDISIQY